MAYGDTPFAKSGKVTVDNAAPNRLSTTAKLFMFVSLTLSLLLFISVGLSSPAAASTVADIDTNAKPVAPLLTQTPTLLENLSDQTPHWLGSPSKRAFAGAIGAHFSAREQSEHLQQLLFAEPNRHSRGLFSKLMEYTLLTEAGYWCRTPTDEHDLDMIAYLLWLQGDLHIAGMTLGDAATEACSVRLTPASIGATQASDAGPLRVPLSDALSSYQARHGLAQSGELDSATLAALQASPQQQLHIIKQNLERLRVDKISSDESTYLIANIPDFKATVFDPNEKVLELKAIVGKKSRPTPEFSSSLVSIVVKPSWNIPSKLMYRDVIPKQIKNPDYLAERGIKVLPAWGSNEFIDPGSIDWKAVKWDLPYKMSQLAGPRNALGQFKFLTPNKRAIYLHDTNARGLFKRDVRAFSSGCVRLQHPEKLAEFLLARNEHSYNVSDLIRKGSTRYLAMRNPISVHYVYWTAWVDSQGQLQHRNDVYEKDAELNHSIQLTQSSTAAAATTVATL